MAFVEARLLECVSYGTRGGPTWATRKVGLKSDIIRRNPRRSRPLYRYTVIYRNIQAEHHIEVVNAFNACLGGVFAFRLKDWADFEADDELISVLGTGSEQTIQLAKIYQFGDRNVVRNIRKPVEDTVTMTADGAPLAVDVDYTTGMATFTAGSGDVLRWSGEFDVPVMFEDDSLSFSGDDKGAGGLFLNSDVSLLEDLSV